MKHKLPYGGDRKAANSERVARVQGYKSGGRVGDDDGGTRISINIGATSPQGADQKAAAAAGLAQALKPPPPPTMPPPMPPGGPPGGGMGLGGPGPVPGMRRGGRAKFDAGAGSGEGRMEKAECASRDHR